ncbi:MAG: hypothetical protein IPK12_19280 [Gemmatimonadetes bacterium]|nr:hypothetical protein [Gemmatimonadota bacterium]
MAIPLAWRRGSRNSASNIEPPGAGSGAVPRPAAAAAPEPELAARRQRHCRSKDALAGAWWSTPPEGRSVVGLVVDSIVDIVEEAIAQSARRPGGISDSAVVQGQVTDLLDVKGALIDRERYRRRDSQHQGSRGPTVLHFLSTDLFSGSRCSRSGSHLGQQMTRVPLAGRRAAASSASRPDRHLAVGPADAAGPARSPDGRRP